TRQGSAQGAGEDSRRSGAVVDLAAGGDAASHGDWVHGEGGAGGAGQAGAAGQELLAGADRVDGQAREADHATTVQSAVVQAGGALECPGAGAQRQIAHLTAAQPDGGVIAEGILGPEHGLGIESRAVSARTGLSDKDQLGRGGRADGNGAGVGAGY